MKMKQYVCSVCGYVYDEEKGIPEAGIAPGTKWEELPEAWVCPLCGAGKGAFHEKQEEAEAASLQELEAPAVEKEVSPMEMSVICSNLSRGCEKQYLLEEAEAFGKLAEFFRQKAEPAADPAVEELAALVEQDLRRDYPYAKAAATEEADRGVLRSLVWSEKVTHMLHSILSRYEAEGEGMLQNTGIFVCTICGFLSIGEAPPEICPVCKVPAWKFEKVEGRMA